MPIVWATSSSIVTISSDNVTIKKLIIISNGTGASGAISATNRFNLTIANNTINNTGSDSNGYGVYFSNTGSSKIENNTINTAGGERNYGIYLSSSSSNSIVRNTINSSGTQGINRGMYLESSSYLNVTQNTILTSGSSGNDGLRFQTCSYLNVTQNNILTSGIYSDFGIVIDGTSNNVAWNTVSTSGTTSSGDNSGIFTSSTYSNFMWNTVAASGNGPNNHGISISGISNVFGNNNITTNSSQSYGVYINAGNNNTFYDSIFNSSLDYDVFLIGTTANTNNYFVNVSFNRSSDIGVNAANVQTKLFVQHRLNAIIRDQSNNALSGVLVYGNDTGSVANIYNPTSNFSTTTNSTGHISTQIFTEFMTNGTYNPTSGYLYFSNYTITTIKSGYFQSSSYLNITSYQNLNIVLEQILSTIEVTAKSLYSLTGLQLTSGTVTVTVLETGESESATISGPQWSVPLYSRTNLNNTGFTLGVNVNDTAGKSGYFAVRIFGDLSLPPQTACTQQRWRLTGTAVDPSTGTFSSSGTVRVDIKDTTYTNSTTFSGGAWEIFVEPCLISGNVYTFDVSLSDGASRNGIIVLRQVAK